MEKGLNADQINLLPIGILFVALGAIVLILRRRKRAEWIEKFYAPALLIVLGLVLCLVGIRDITSGHLREGNFSGRAPSTNNQGTAAQEEPYRIVVTWKDYIWITCTLAMIALFVVRKIVLAWHGYGISLIDYGSDGRRLRAIARKERSPLFSRLLQAINLLIPILFVLALVIVILSRVIFAAS